MYARVLLLITKSGYRYKRILSRLFSILHRRYTDLTKPQQHLWCFWWISGINGCSNTRIAAIMCLAIHTPITFFRHTKRQNRRFLPKNSYYDDFVVLLTKKRPDTRTKTAQKRTKKCFTHTLHRGPKYTGFFADFRNLHIFEKSLDFCDFLIYYSFRYSGIVQSVEQRTVNPYVTGSSPVARATNSVAKSLILRRFFFVNTFGFRHTTIHLKTPLFNPLATQQLHRIRNLSAVR